jgi:hypothetical protein
METIQVISSYDENNEHMENNKVDKKASNLYYIPCGVHKDFE